VVPRRAERGLLWARDDVVLFSTSGGSPNVVCLYGAQPPEGDSAKGENPRACSCSRPIKAGSCSDMTKRKLSPLL
jgi:hypothetical protein